MTTEDCIFCKIIQGKIPAARIFENDDFLCIKDIQPQAKVHLLIFPKQHVESLVGAYLSDWTSERKLHLGALLEVATQIANSQGLVPNGFRVVINNGHHGGQTVAHLHLHLLGGEVLRGGFGS